MNASVSSNRITGRSFTSAVVYAVFNPPIIPTNHPPQIVVPLSITNALLQVASNAVITANETNVFTVSASDDDNDTLDYAWVFGDGATTNTAADIVEHVYTNGCGPLSASVTVSDGQAATNSDLTVAIACQMQITKLQARPNFKKSNADKFNLTASVELPDGFDPSGKSVSVDVGGAQATFTLGAKGKGANAQGTCKLSFNNKTSTWTLKVSQKNGDWQTPWAAAGLVNADVPKPGAAVTLPVVALVDNEGFAVDQPALYTAKAGKSGTAKQQ